MLGGAPIGGLPIGGFQLQSSSSAYALTLDAGVYTSVGTGVTLRYSRRLNVWNELVTNGYFDVDTSGWTIVGDPGVTFAATNGNGTLTVPGNGGVGHTYQAISVVPGYTYQLAVNFGPGSNAFAGLSVGIREGGSEIGSVDNRISNSGTLTFVAPASTVYLSLYPFQVVISSGSTTPPKVVSLNKISLRQTGNFIISGPDITMSKGYTLNMPGGVYTVAGPTISLRVARQMTAIAGVYNLTGTSVALRMGRRISLGSGIYTLTGTGLTLKAQRYLTTSGTYTVNGSSILLTRKYVMPIAAGAYGEVGTAVTLRWGHRLSQAPGVYELDGTTVVMSYHEVSKVSPDPGIYALTFAPGSFTYHRALTVPAGTYVVQGHVPTLRAARALTHTPGVYTITGSNLDMVIDHVTMALNLGVYAVRMGPAQMFVARKMSVAAGAYSITGSNISLKVARYLQGAGSYALTGTNFSLLAGRRAAIAAGIYAISGTPITTLRLYKLSVTPGIYAVVGSPFSFKATRQLSIDPHHFQINLTVAQLTYVRLQGGPRVLTVDITASRYLAAAPQTRYAAVSPQSRYVAATTQLDRYAAVYPVDDRDYAVPPLDRVA